MDGGANGGGTSFTYFIPTPIFCLRSLLVRQPSNLEQVVPGIGSIVESIGDQQEKQGGRMVIIHLSPDDSSLDYYISGFHDFLRNNHPGSCCMDFDRWLTNLHEIGLNPRDYHRLTDSFERLAAGKQV